MNKIVLDKEENKTLPVEKTVWAKFEDNKMQEL